MVGAMLEFGIPEDVIDDAVRMKKMLLALKHEL